MFNQKGKTNCIFLKYLSSPPNGIEISVERGEKFKICEYNWWDHSLALGTQIHRYTDTRIHRYTDTRIHGYIWVKG